MNIYRDYSHDLTPELIYKLSLTSLHQGSAGFCSDTVHHITVSYHSFLCHAYTGVVQQGTDFLSTCGLDELWTLPKNR